MLCIFMQINISLAQSFVRRTTDKPLTFLEIQKQFDEWKKSTDISKVKGWKSFKRFEMDMQYHTDGKGNPGNPKSYIQAITDAAAQKQQENNSRFQSAAWIPVGPYVIPNNLTGYMENGIGRINCIAFHPTDPATYFVGVAQGGVWKTSNNGQSWIPLTDNLPITRISDIEIDPSNPDVMYISVCDFEYIGFGLFLNGRKRNTHYGLGVYKTTDGGLTWNPTGLSFLLTDGDASLIRKVIVNPTAPNKLVACGVSGMYTSNDGGINWTQRLDSLFWDMKIDPSNPYVLYAATGWVNNSNTGSAGIYKSNDFGITWTMLNTGFPPTGVIQRVKLGIAPSDPNYIYAVTVDVGNGMEGLYQSTDAGATWNSVGPGLNLLAYGDGFSSGGQGTYDLGFCINQNNKDLIYVGGINVWVSDDGAATFNPASDWTTSYGPTLHGDIHFIEQQPSTGNLFVCNDGGIYRTNFIEGHSWADANSGIPWPTQWTNLGNGLGVTSFYRLSSSQNATGRLIAGAQDNASLYYDGTSWSTIFGGDGMDNYLNPDNDQEVIGCSQYGNFYFSNDNGVTNFGIYPNINGEIAEWTTPIISDYTNPGTLFVGFENVMQSVDYGNSWTSISNFTTQTGISIELSALAVGVSNPNVLVAARRVRYEYNEPGALFVSANGGNTWNDRTAGIPDSLYYTSVEVNRQNANEIYVTMAGFSAGNKVFKSINNGVAWQNISYNLPNIPVNCVKNIPGTNKLIAATDIGVYTLDAGSTTWVMYNLGLPNVIVSDIEFNQALNKVYVSTFGRGIWATDLDVVASVPENKVEIAAELYPTFNKGKFTIALKDKALQAETITLTVTDITGRTIQQMQLSGQSVYSIDLQLNSGKYFAQLSGKGVKGAKSFIVE